MTAQLISWQSLLDLGWLLFLLLVFWYFLRARQITRQTQFWVKTRGRITQFEFTIHRHSLWPKIEYIYQVGERDFTGEYFFLDTVHTDPNSKRVRLLAYNIANAYKKNEDIDVYYNPDKPEQAVLDTTIPPKLNLILVFTPVLIVLHIVIVILKIFN